MSLPERIKPYLNYIKVATLLTFGGGTLGYQVLATHRKLSNILNTSVLEKEKKMTPDYIYIDDITYLSFKNEFYKQGKELGIWRSVRQSVLYRLMRLCKMDEYRDMALQQIASIRRARDWECLSVAQCLDSKTAVDLARTEGCDARYMLPPPRSARLSHHVAHELLEVLGKLKCEQSHSCLDLFLSKNQFNVQDFSEADIPTKPATMNARELTIQSLQMLHHHILIYLDKDEETPLHLLRDLGIHSILAGTLITYSNDSEVEHAVLKLLAVLALLDGAHVYFHLFGLLRYLCKWIKSRDIKLGSTAALTLHNLGEANKFRPGLYLLHPLYRSARPTCDVVIVHGLRGGVFSTWRQRDPKDQEPLGLIDCLATYDNEKSILQKASEIYVADPYLSQVFKELEISEEENLLADFELVVRDLPVATSRAKQRSYTVENKRAVLLQEAEDKSPKTTCWPKDWLPKDCKDIRVIGVNYETWMSYWFEGCNCKEKGIAARARTFARDFYRAGLGHSTPIVWLGHSMGGIIVKKIIVDSYQNEQHSENSLYNLTRGCVFFSTPHRGSKVAEFGTTLKALLAPSHIVTELCQGSPTLKELHKDFLEAIDASDIDIVSFAETKPTFISPFKVAIHFVQPDSADMGRGEFFVLPLDHLSICKPVTRQSLIYSSVVEMINRAKTTRTYKSGRNQQ